MLYNLYGMCFQRVLYCILLRSVLYEVNYTLNTLTLKPSIHGDLKSWSAQELTELNPLSSE